MISSYLALRNPEIDTFTKRLSVFLASFFLFMSCIVFVCNLSFMILDNKNSEEDILVNRVALDLAMEALTNPNLKKEIFSNNNF